MVISTKAKKNAKPSKTKQNSNKKNISTQAKKKTNPSVKQTTAKKVKANTRKNTATKQGVKCVSPSKPRAKAETTKKAEKTSKADKAKSLKAKASQIKGKGTNKTKTISIKKRNSSSSSNVSYASKDNIKHNLSVVSQSPKKAAKTPTTLAQKVKVSSFTRKSTLQVTKVKKISISEKTERQRKPQKESTKSTSRGITNVKNEEAVISRNRRQSAAKNPFCPVINEKKSKEMEVVKEKTIDLLAKKTNSGGHISRRERTPVGKKLLDASPLKKSMVNAMTKQRTTPVSRCSPTAKRAASRSPRGRITKSLRVSLVKLPETARRSRRQSPASSDKKRLQHKKMQLGKKQLKKTDKKAQEKRQSEQKHVAEVVEQNEPKKNHVEEKKQEKKIEETPEKINFVQNEPDKQLQDKQPNNQIEQQLSQKKQQEQKQPEESQPEQQYLQKKQQKPASSPRITFPTKIKLKVCSKTKTPTTKPRVIQLKVDAPLPKRIDNIVENDSAKHTTTDSSDKSTVIVISPDAQSQSAMPDINPQKKILCLDCGEPFADRRSLVQHKRTSCSTNITMQCNSSKEVVDLTGNLTQRRWKCDKCISTFHTQQALGVHKNKCQMLKKNDQFVRCSYCGVPPIWFPGFPAFLAHLKELHKDLPPVQRLFMCSVCTCVFVSFEDLEDHKRTGCEIPKDKVQSTRCFVCNTYFKDNETYSKHKKTCKKEGVSYFCTLCPSKPTFSMQKDLNIHKKKHHQGIGLNLFKCNHCYRSFDYEEDFKSHLDSVHARPEPSFESTPIHGVKQNSKGGKELEINRRGLGCNSAATAPYITELAVNSGPQLFDIKIDTSSGQPKVSVGSNKPEQNNTVVSTANKESSEGQGGSPKKLQKTQDPIICSTPPSSQVKLSIEKHNLTVEATNVEKSKHQAPQQLSPQLITSTCIVKKTEQRQLLPKPIPVKVATGLGKVKPNTPFLQKPVSGKSPVNPNKSKPTPPKRPRAAPKFDESVVGTKTKLLEARNECGKKIMVPIAITQGIHVEAVPGSDSVKCTECKLIMSSMSEVSNHVCMRCLRCESVINSLIQVAQHICREKTV